MVTRDRPELARRAITCFLAQTWPHRELVIVDDGDRSYDDLVASYDDPRIRYVRLPSSPSQRLGALRNASQDLARGEYRVQWDDDEWYHPERIERQMRPILDEGWDASLLQYTLMHCDTPALAMHPFRTGLPFGTPGSLLHRRTRARYPNRARGEDSAFLRSVFLRQRVARLGRGESHLLIRCFHGDNTWNVSHFTERLWSGPRARFHWLKARYLDRDLYRHAAFDLEPRERIAFHDFLDVSRRLGLLRHLPSTAGGALEALEVGNLP